MQGKAGIVIQRILFGAMAIAFLLALFMGDYAVAQWAFEQPHSSFELLRHGSIVPLAFFILIALGVAEMLRLLRARGLQPFAFPAYAGTLALLLIPWLAPAGYLGDSIPDREGLYWPLAVMAFSLLVIGACCVLRNNPKGTIQNGSGTMLIIVYLGFLSSFALQIRSNLSVPSQHHHQGVWLLINVILITKCSDIGGYLTGSALGRHKLIPAISPGKTVEGAIGGLIASGLVAVLFAWPGRIGGTVGDEPAAFLRFWSMATSSFGNAFPGEGWGVIGKAFCFGAILSFFAQIGDLFESCLKRDAAIKDSGAVMPHYGGVLDLVDSPLFTLPVAWFLLTRVWNVP
jgi:phosphatidate cytidylyltransferase